MENFTEVNQPITPKKEIGSILSHAFENFTGTFLYALVFVALRIRDVVGRSEQLVCGRPKIKWKTTLPCYKCDGKGCYKCK